MPAAKTEATGEATSLSPYRHFTAGEWGRLRQDTPLPLSAKELEELKGFGERISLDEVWEIFLPLSRLLNLYVGETQELYRVTSDFLGRVQDKVPYIIGVAGSVAVGKSTMARILRTLLARWPNHPKVDLITTDGFLYPNKVLEERGLMQRKGFPESFDTARLLNFLADVKSGKERIEAPIYSHFHYDIMPGQKTLIERPDILIVEGLNVLQPARVRDDGRTSLAVSDFFDFSVYVDAGRDKIRRWYIERFLRLRETAFRDPESYFSRYGSLSHDEAVAEAERIWDSINGPNLVENILPTRSRATLVMRKDWDHSVRYVRLRKL